ncbi:MAG: SPOR domain-containing protein, partial [Sphingopyxis sp.]
MAVNEAQRRWSLWCGAGGLALLQVLIAPPLSAQDTVPAGVTAPAPDPETTARLAAQRDLTSALARIAANPTDGFALSQAGRAALVLGDGRAAIGFLARAEAQAPRDPVIKAAMGAAMVQLEDPVQAMRYFDAAIAAGGLDRTYIADRGLAFDLLGNQARAQADYAVAATTHPSAELTRRTAISLGISGQADRAVQLLGPLLRAQDRAAWRSRAMIVAMNGRTDEAREIARATMPRQLADGLEPYFTLMDRLTPAQLASAAHFGRFPSAEVVSAQPSRAAARTVVAVATPAPQPPASTGRGARRSNRDARRTAVTATPPPIPAPTPVIVDT